MQLKSLQDSFGALLSLGLSEGAASSGKVEEVKKALTKAFWQIMDDKGGPLGNGLWKHVTQ